MTFSTHILFCWTDFKYICSLNLVTGKKSKKDMTLTPESAHPFRPHANSSLKFKREQRSTHHCDASEPGLGQVSPTPCVKAYKKMQIARLVTYTSLSASRIRGC